MWKWLEVKRLVLISPEFLIGVIVVTIQKFEPQWFSAISAGVRARDQLPSFLGAIAVALVVASWRLGNDVLRPGAEGENRILYEWPYYWALETRVYGGMVICTLGAVAFILYYVDPFKWTSSIAGAVLIASLIVPTVSVGTLVVARMQVRKILTLYG